MNQVYQRDELIISSSLEMLDEVYSWIRNHLTRIPINDGRRYEILLASGEAITNAIRHGNREDPTSDVSVVIETLEHQVTVTVHDSGSGFDPDRLPDPTEGDSLFKQNGRGVFLLRSLADDVQFYFSPTGTTVEARFLT